MEAQSRSQFSQWLAMFLPGIFLLGFNIGTGSVTSMAKAGAAYGMSLVWTIIAYGQFTLVTGETDLQVFRKHIHPAVGIFFYCCADGRREWQRHRRHGHCGGNQLRMVEGGIRPVYFAAFFITLVSAIRRRLALCCRSLLTILPDIFKSALTDWVPTSTISLTCFEIAWTI